jgi:hypothetical protein
MSTMLWLLLILAGVSFAGGLLLTIRERTHETDEDRRQRVIRLLNDHL